MCNTFLTERMNYQFSMGKTILFIGCQILRPFPTMSENKLVIQMQISRFQ